MENTLHKRNGKSKMDEHLTYKKMEAKKCLLSKTKKLFLSKKYEKQKNSPMERKVDTTLYDEKERILRSEEEEAELATAF